MGNGSEKGGEDEERSVDGRDDRLWVLLDRAAPEPPGGDRGATPRRTIIVRDGERVLISVPVGRDSALAVPLKIDQLPCAGARLVVRVASEITPCAACVEERLLSACAGGALDTGGILAAVHAAIDRCAELQRRDPGHRVERPSDPPPSRTGAALRHAPPTSGNVPTGPAGDMDIILIL